MFQWFRYRCRELRLCGFGNYQFTIRPNELHPKDVLALGIMREAQSDRKCTRADCGLVAIGKDAMECANDVQLALGANGSITEGGDVMGHTGIT